jgi:hypothetical protein
MNVSKLFERLGVKTAGEAAGIAFHRFVSDRSVAIVDKRGSGSVELGSGVLIKIEDHCLVATAGHVLEGKNPAAVTIVPPGNISTEPLDVRRMNKVDRQNNLVVDVGWLELNAEQCQRNGILFLSLDQIRPLRNENRVEACFLHGYPSDSATASNDGEQIFISEVQSFGALQLSIPPERRGDRHQAGVDIAIEYPSQDGSLDNAGFPEPFGLSGGGVWLFPRFDEYQVWSPEKATLIGIDRGWWREEREAVATRVEWWLRLVAKDLPNTRQVIENVLAATTTATQMT